MELDTERLNRAAEALIRRAREGNRSQWLTNMRELVRRGWHTESAISCAVYHAPTEWMIAAGLGIEVKTRLDDGTPHSYRILTLDEWDAMVVLIEAMRAWPGATMMRATKTLANTMFKQDALCSKQELPLS